MNNKVCTVCEHEIHIKNFYKKFQNVKILIPKEV